MVEVFIRQIQEDDAEAFLSLAKQLDEETTFMLKEPGERKSTVEGQTAKIKSILESENSMILVAEATDRLVGFIGGFGGPCLRNRHSMHVVIGILQEFAGKRIGTRLFEELEGWAVKNGIRKMDLTVMVNNERGIKLYEKVGFEFEGRKRDSMFVDGQYVDEHYMGKVLTPRAERK